MTLCAVLYLSWWIIFFRPDAPNVTGILYYVGVACIVCAALAGIAGAVMIGVGTSQSSVAGLSPSGWWFALGAVMLYILLAFATSRLMGRPITTELLLFVVWTAVEIACIVTLGSADAFSRTTTLVLVIVVALVFAGMLVTYLLYYHLAPLPSFIDGAIPLAVVGMFSIAMMICINSASQL